jgi:hypothetical protein
MPSVNMQIKGMTTEALLSLAETYAAHVNRGLYTLADRVGVHSRFFVHLKEGRGCHSGSMDLAIKWFDANWPADLAWPAAVVRPSTMARKGRAA